jgi:Ser/Thr protein kinase RdoA (MazF antagonist)
MAGAEVLDLAEDDVRQVLLRGYGIRAADIEVVSGEVATVCRVAAGRQVLALKAMPAGDPAGEALVRWQTEAMVMLQRSGLPVPTTVVDRAGHHLHAHDVDGRLVLVHLTAWLSDPPLGEVPVDTALLREVGRTAGRVHLALTALRRPPAPVTHPWELARTEETLRSALTDVADPLVAGLTTAALGVFRSHVAPCLPDLPRAVVHHDLHDANLLVGTGADGRRRVTGILDFGDLVVGPRLAELAVAAGYAARNTADPAAALLDVAGGWSEVAALTPLERACLLPAATARLAVNAAVWASRMTGPRAAYARSRVQGTAQAVERLLATDRADFADELGARLQAAGA